MADRYASLKQGLVGCWIPSVSGSGLLLPDLSGRGNNGSLVGMNASDWISSSVGRVLNFGLYSAKIPTCKDSPTLNITSDKLSLSVFVNNLNSNEWQGCFHKCNANTPGYQLFITDANKIAFGIDTTVSGFTRLTGGTLPSGVCHLACVYDGQQMITYINGRLDTSTTKTGNITDSSGIDLFLNTSRVAQQSIVSWATDWRVYNRPLTTSEVAILASEPGIGFKPAKKLSRFSQRFTYNPPKARNYSVVRVKETDYATLRQGLVGAWCPSLPSGGSGNTLPDVSGYNNHGSLVNMSPDDWVSSQYGRALDFDGVDDFVQLSSISDSSGQITATAWARQTVAISLAVYAVFSSCDSAGAILPFQLESLQGKWGFIWGASPYVRIQVSFDLIPNQWYHLALVRSGSTGNWSYRFFVDGIERLSGTTIINPGASNPIALARNGNRNAQYFPGNIDDVRLYNRALSDSEIRLLASRPGIGLRQDRDRNTFYQFPSFQPAITRRSSAIIGGGIT